MMKREECEKQIRDLMIQIDKVYHEYNPEGTYLNMFIIGDFALVNNSYYRNDVDRPLDMHYQIEEK